MSSPSEKSRRKAIKMQLKSKEAEEFEKAQSKRQREFEMLLESTQLEECCINSEEKLFAILARLNSLRLTGAIKIMKGSFNLNSIVTAEFVEVKSGQMWILNCLNEAPSGGGTLKKK